MLLKNWRKELFHPECNPSFSSYNCVAHLEQNIAEALPYLNTELGGDQYIDDPPSLTLRINGRLLTLHGDRIAINTLTDEAQADKILAWLQREINQAWERRHTIKPSRQSAPQPQLLECLKLLPGTNCGECGQPTCTVFASLLCQGAKGVEDCPQLEPEYLAALEDYLSRFNLEV